MIDAVAIAQAIRAALEELALCADDAQGSYGADVYLGGFAKAEEAALTVLAKASKEPLPEQQPDGSTPR